MSGTPMTEEELANLSDDELMGMAIAPSAQAPAASEPGSNEEAPNVSADAPESVLASEGEPEGEGAGLEDDAGDLEGDDADDPDAANAVEADASGEGDAEDAEAGAEGTAPAAAKAPDSEKPAGAAGDAKAEVKPAEPIDYKAAYDRIMGGFKANGKQIKLESLDEAVQLMQMGANYTKKLQALQPNLKLLKMLENNELLDEGKLSYLIDINRKDPKAIQKLLRESGIDPMDIDTTVDPQYQPGNHSVSDEQIRLTTTLEEIAEDPQGKAFILEIHKTWDDPSKEALWGDPDIVRTLTDQKKNGIYDRIVSEVERRKILGHLTNVPFLKAYETVGMELQSQGLLKPAQPAAGDPNSGNPSQNRVVATRRPEARTVSNNERAKAASPTKAAARKPAKPDFNPLALSDEDFEKNAALAQRI
jgi:hypothetical protein